MEKSDNGVAPTALPGNKEQSAPETINVKIVGHEGFVNPALKTHEIIFTPEEPEEISAGVAPPGREVNSSNAAESIIVLPDISGPADTSSDTAPLRLEDWAFLDWAKSGITTEVAQQLGFRCVREDEICDIIGFRPRTENGICEGYAIPFIDPVTGQQMLCKSGRPYIRIKMRYLGIMGVDKAKYLSPQKAGQHAYIQLEVHEYYMENELSRIILTEGEKKIICGKINNILGIGLVGNWGWKDTADAQKDDILPELKPYAVPGRSWLIIWDSDASDSRKKNEFELSTKRLAKVLKRYGGQLEQLILPAITADGKTGLDDFLVHHGKNFLGEITNLIQNTATVVNPDLRALTSAENGEQGGRQPMIQTIVGNFINEHQIRI